MTMLLITAAILKGAVVRIAAYNGSCCCLVWKMRCDHHPLPPTPLRAHAPSLSTGYGQESWPFEDEHEPASDIEEQLMVAQELIDQGMVRSEFVYFAVRAGFRRGFPLVLHVRHRYFVSRRLSKYRL